MNFQELFLQFKHCLLEVYVFWNLSDFPSKTFIAKNLKVSKTTSKINMIQIVRGWMRMNSILLLESSMTVLCLHIFYNYNTGIWQSTHFPMHSNISDELTRM